MLEYLFDLRPLGLRNDKVPRTKIISAINTKEIVGGSVRIYHRTLERRVVLSSVPFIALSRDGSCALGRDGRGYSILSSLPEPEVTWSDYWR